jgi:RNA polymerase sigma-70 factor (ECF subfamily)
LFLRTESDAKLVARARKQDVEAFNHLVSRWEKRLYNYLLRLLRNREDSLDLSQEAFLKAYRSLGTLEDAEKFPQWLFRIAHNLAFSHLRRNDAVAEAEGWPEDDREGALAASSATPIPLGPAGHLAGLELELTVAKAMEALTPEQREAITLKVYHGFQFAEIAEILSCPLSTVKSRIYAGFAQLREILTAEPVERASAKQRR